MAININDRAQIGFAKSAAYDQHRPSYPPASVQELLTQVRVAGKKGAKIVDLAAGTGKFTEALAARDEQYETIAIEPHDGMCRVLAGKNLPRVTVKPGKADSMPLEDSSVDAVTIAQVRTALPPPSSYPVGYTDPVSWHDHHVNVLVEPFVPRRRGRSDE